MKDFLLSIDEALIEVGYKPISDIINNYNKCHNYIIDILTTHGKEDSVLYINVKQNLRYRLKHIVYTFGIGVLISKFMGLKEKIENEFKYFNNHILNNFFFYWMLVSIYHDYGYFINDKFSQCNNIKEINVNYNIFDKTLVIPNSIIGDDADNILNLDSICPRYSYDTLNNYFIYSKNIWGKGIILEHGILGGLTVFSDLVINTFNKINKLNKGKNLTRQNFKNGYFDHKTGILFKESDINIFKKIGCNIMEHNIWKCYDKVDEENYLVYRLNEIMYDNFNKINDESPLLKLLSIVDTIEFIKVFCRDDNEEIAKKFSLNNPVIISNKIKIEVTDKKILINYEELEIYLNSKEILNSDSYKELFKEINCWVKSVNDLTEWVDVKTEREKELKQLIIEPA